MHCMYFLLLFMCVCVWLFFFIGRFEFTVVFFILVCALIFVSLVLRLISLGSRVCPVNATSHEGSVLHRNMKEY